MDQHFVQKRRLMLALVRALVTTCYVLVWFHVTMSYLACNGIRRSRMRSYSMNVHNHRAYVKRLVHSSDMFCFSQLRMRRDAFFRLCEMLTSIGGLSASPHLEVDEQVAMFLHVLAHHQKTRTLITNFGRSGETISRYINRVLVATMKLDSILYATPEAIQETCVDETWKWFQGCCGAVDGTHIRVHVPLDVKPRYRTRKGEVATNILGVCNPRGEFIYVLAGWEGSAADSRVLTDALTRRDGFKVPQGCFYLVDAGYSHCPGFAAPYRGQRYHLSDWDSAHRPRNHKEMWNMRHSRARNIIERCFSMIKTRWAILRSPSFYPIRTQNRIVLACCLLHNFIRKYTTDEDTDFDDCAGNHNDNLSPSDDNFPPISPTTEWTLWRDNLATQMFNSTNYI